MTPERWLRVPGAEQPGVVFHVAFDLHPPVREPCCEVVAAERRRKAVDVLVVFPANSGGQHQACECA